jgi:benzoate-CoA ligase
MDGLSHADRSVSPPTIRIPRRYNAAHDLIERNLAAGRAEKVAYVDDTGPTTYGELAHRVDRVANALVGLGLRMEDRILLAHLDAVEFPVVFLAALKAGIVPVAVNTLLTPADYAFLLADSRARALVVSSALLPVFTPILDGLPHLERVVVSGDAAHGHLSLRELEAAAADGFTTAPTTCDDVAFWLYSSGSTGTPKGTFTSTRA